MAVRVARMAASWLLNSGERGNGEALRLGHAYVAPADHSSAHHRQCRKARPRTAREYGAAGDRSAFPVGWLVVRASRHRGRADGNAERRGSRPCRRQTLRSALLVKLAGEDAGP